ncbi:MAG: hypothetical protein HQL90_13305 [Magnetococcales bacterium]|nr:hypothetical protein [Magnetococcales bacterium]
MVCSRGCSCRRMLVVGHRAEMPRLLALWLVVLLLAIAWAGEAHAFSTVLKVNREADGKREILSFSIPPGATKPRAELTDPTTLRLVVPGLLALPASALDPDHSRLIAGFKMDDLHGEEMGLDITIKLKSPNLVFRDSLGKSDIITGAPYRLEIDTPVAPSSTKEIRLLEGRVLTGRDGTLVIFSHTGEAKVDNTMDLAAHQVRLNWRGATLDPGWRLPASAGLAERLLSYGFSDQVEMELVVHPDVTNVRFHQDVEAGLYIVELFSKEQMGRQMNAEDILRERKDALASGEVRPLNRLDPAFVIRPDRTIVLKGKTVDEGYYLNSARNAARDQKYARARSYLKKMLDLFPDTFNREPVDFYLWNLSYKMNWKPGWLLAGLHGLLSRYPNTVHYPHYRLLELHLLNRSGLYGEANAMMWDPNLPHNDRRVWLERGHTAVGLARSRVEPKANWQAANKYLQKVLEMTGDKGDISAEARYLLARAAQDQPEESRVSAPEMLDGLTLEQLAFIANRPDWLMHVADIYYENRLYPQATKFYSQFLTNYPAVKEIVPWAMLRAAESSWQLGRLEQPKSLRQTELYDHARYLFSGLQEKYPDTDAAVWGQVFQLRMDEGEAVVTRLQKINEVVKTIRLPDALSELLMAKAELQGDDKRYEDALVTLNRLVSTSVQAKVVERAIKLKRTYLLKGMQHDLEDDRPEHAILLVELNGEDFRSNPDFARPRILLAEALMRIGLVESVPTLLKGITSPTAVRLTQLARAFAEEQWPEVMAPPETGAAVKAMREARPTVGTGVPPVEEGFSAVEASTAANRTASMEIPNGTDPSSLEMVPVEEARVRLDAATRLQEAKEWESVLRLLDKLPDRLLSAKGEERRLRLMAKAEEGRERYPFAVQYLEDLLSGKKLQDGSDYYWYATVLQKWKGDTKALPAFKRVSEEAEDKDVQALAHIRVGDIMQRAGEYATARDHYLEAEKLAPGSPWAKVSKENAAQLAMAMEVKK